MPTNTSHGFEWLTSTAGVVSLGLVPGSTAVEFTGSGFGGIILQAFALALAIFGLGYRLWR